jgi:hypothetical protein
VLAIWVGPAGAGGQIDIESVFCGICLDADSDDDGVDDPFAADVMP